MNIRVILADDHPLILLGVRHALSGRLGISVVAEATEPKDLMDKLATVACDVVVTDFSMPGGEAPDGLVMLKAIRTWFPAVRIVVLTMLENPGLAVSMRNAGALGILNKRGDLSELPAAIVEAFHGRKKLGRSVQRDIDECDAAMSATRGARALSPRELEIIRLYVGGMTTSEVARYLNRSVNTISTQKHSAMRKLGVSNDSALFDYALAHGLKPGTRP